MHNSKNIKVRKGIFAPSTGEHHVFANQFIWRNTKKFVGDSEIVIMDNKENAWWNRPAESDTLCKKEADGLYSYNMPFLGLDADRKDLYKTEYNVLVNLHSVPCVAHIKIDDTWTEEQKRAINRIFFRCIYDTLIDLGVPESSLVRSGNDILFNGKKFVGSEELLTDDIYVENVIVTLQFLPEKDIFARLTGKYAHKRQITGIADEVPSITKEAFIDKLYEKICAYVEEHFN